MKTVITSSNANLEAMFSPRFGRCPYFIIIDTETREWEAFPNPAVDAGAGSGPQAVQCIANHDVEAVVSGRYGPNAYSALEVAGIQTFIASSGMVRDVFEKFLAKELEQVSSATGAELHDKGRLR